MYIFPLYICFVQIIVFIQFMRFWFDLIQGHMMAFTCPRQEDLTGLPAAVWFHIWGVGPLLNFEAQLLTQNPDRGRLPAAGRSSQNQNAALQKIPRGLDLTLQPHRSSFLMEDQVLSESNLLLSWFFPFWLVHPTSGTRTNLGPVSVHPGLHFFHLLLVDGKFSLHKHRVSP